MTIAIRSFFSFFPVALVASAITFSEAVHAELRAQTYSEFQLSCYQSYAAAEYSTAAQACNNASAAGDSQAQYLLATMYIYGAGVQADLKTSVELLVKAAKQGHIKAAYNLGAAFDLGEAVQQDYAAALKWYSVAANAGMPEAQLGLAEMYEFGKGIEANFEKAFQWYSSAASQGYSSAQFKLGLMYQQGKGTKQDLKKAASWLKLAAQSGDANAQLAYGLLIAPKSPDEGIFWLERAGHRGLGVAYYQLARMLSQSPQSAGLERAVSYAERAIFEGQPDALALRNNILVRLEKMENSENDTISNEAAQKPSTSERKVAKAEPLTSQNSNVVSSGANFKSGDWLLSQSGSDYTIQLKHDPDEKVIERYIDNNNLGSESTYYATLREAGVVYVLVYGVFDSARAANTAVKTLPPVIQNSGPWVRKFKQLQSKYRSPLK